MATTPRTYRLPDDVIAALEQQPNATEYLVGLVRRASPRLDAIVALRAEALTHARAHLADEGWTAGEVAAVMECTSGPHPGGGLPHYTSMALGAEMADAERLHRDADVRLGRLLGVDRATGPAASRGIPPERWAQLCALVAESEPTARALWVVAAEWWAEHDGVREWLRAT